MIDTLPRALAGSAPGSTRDLFAAIGAQQDAQIDGDPALARVPSIQTRSSVALRGCSLRFDLEVQPFELDVLERIPQQDVERRHDRRGGVGRGLVAREQVLEGDVVVVLDARRAAQRVGADAVLPLVATSACSESRRTRAAA